MSDKKEIEQRLEKVDAQVLALLEESNGIRALLSEESTRDLVGRCFKTENFFSAPETVADHWYTWFRVVRVKGSEAFGVYIEKDANGIITYNPYDERHAEQIRDSWTEVSRGDFDATLARLARQVASGMSYHWQHEIVYLDEKNDRVKKYYHGASQRDAFHEFRSTYPDVEVIAISEYHSEEDSHVSSP